MHIAHPAADTVAPARTRRAAGGRGAAMAVRKRCCARLSRRVLHAGAVALIVSIPFLLGLGWHHIQWMMAGQQEADHGRIAMSKLEAMLDQVHSTVDASLPLAAGDCVEVVDALRLKAATLPQARSLVLARDGMAYCSTLYGEIAVPTEAMGLSDDAVTLVAGNEVAPDRPLLLYRLSRGPHEAVAVLDALHVRQSLQEGRESAWVVAAKRLERAGGIRVLSPDADAESRLVTSSRHPVAIAADAGDEQAKHSRGPSSAAWLLMALAGMPMGYLFHRWTIRRRALKREFQRAVRDGEFVPFYQPIVRCADRNWAGVEVLARWEHPGRGLLAPDRFMPQLEHSDFLLPMTAGLMSRAARELAGMLSLLPAGFHVAFNITPAHLSARWLPEHCRRFLAAFPPGRIALVLELTEREGVVPDADVLAVLDEVRRLGVRIALDDFGVGHSNLSHLQELHADRLKIDRGFVTRLPDPDGITPILRTILDLAERLDLDVVAEGVEIPAQADALARHGVAFLQGYLFARPLPASSLPGTLASRPPWFGDARGMLQPIDMRGKMTKQIAGGRKPAHGSVSLTEAE